MGRWEAISVTAFVKNSRYFGRVGASLLMVVAIGVAMSGCQQGKRTDGASTSVHREGVARCDSLANQLQQLEVNVHGAFPSYEDQEAILPPSAKTPEKLSKVQSLLIDYLMAANHLLDLGDSSVVVFPEKDKINTSRARASKYLAQIYADRKWQVNEREAYSTSEVAQYEFNIRFSRYLKIFRALAEYGFKFETEKDFQEHKTIAANLAAEKLSQVDRLPTEEASLDIMRSKELVERYDGWNNKGIKKIAGFADFFGASVWSVRLAVKNELKNRGGRPLNTKRGRK